MSGFDDFWAAYPRKVGKLAAQKEWRKLNPSQQTQQEMAAALEWQREQWDDPQYIPHPRTWLSQGRWMDEPPAPKPVVKPKGALGNVIRYMQGNGTNG